ncbi:MAG: hypothetical protein NC299_03140 [Lachnospiraceae bacterium]|nr:hypothetical protein [Ruminococcus sp.]MCM1274346.1 hypothetical protein [Lachnospiraceae bacterium]
MKKRIITFSILTAVAAAFLLIFTFSLCHLAAVRTDFAENVDELTVDGTDFTPIIKAGAGLLDIFVSDVIPVLLLIVYVVVLLLLNAALFGFYRLFGLREEFSASAEERRLANRIFAAVSIGGAAAVLLIEICAAVFFGSSALCFWGLLFCWQYPLFAWAFFLRRLKTTEKTTI